MIPKPNLDISAIGQSLAKHSKKTEFSAQRGLVAELYPFIYSASKRMSARAISRFLGEQHCVKLSAVTITKALNDPKKYWRPYIDSILPIIRIVEEGSKLPAEEFMFNLKLFHKLLEDEAEKRVNSQRDRSYFEECLLTLLEKWFCLDEVAFNSGCHYMRIALAEMKGKKPKGKAKQ